MTAVGCFPELATNDRGVEVGDSPSAGCLYGGRRPVDETWGFGLPGVLATVVNVQRVLLLGSRDGV